MQKGFTLIEILVVVLIIGITITAVSLTGTRKVQTNTGAKEQILTLLRNTHDYAMSNQKILGLFFTEDRLFVSEFVGDMAGLAEGKKTTYEDWKEQKYAFVSSLPFAVKINVRDPLKWNFDLLRLQDRVHSEKDFPQLVFLPDGTLFPAAEVQIYTDEKVESIRWGKFGDDWLFATQ